MSEVWWFEPKRCGYGAGRPRTWQAWALTAGYSLTVVGAAYGILPNSLVAFLAIMLAATAAFLLACARKTRGGWRWRGGPEISPPERSRQSRRRTV